LKKKKKKKSNKLSKLTRNTVASDNDVQNTMAGESDTNSSSSNEDLEHLNDYLIETLTNNIRHLEKKRTKLSTRFRNTFTSGDSEEEMLESQNVINVSNNGNHCNHFPVKAKIHKTQKKKSKRMQRRTVDTKKTEWQDSTRPRPNLWLMEFLKMGNLATTAQPGAESSAKLKLNLTTRKCLKQ